MHLYKVHRHSTRINPICVQRDISTFPPFRQACRPKYQHAATIALDPEGMTLHALGDCGAHHSNPRWQSSFPRLQCDLGNENLNLRVFNHDVNT